MLKVVVFNLGCKVNQYEADSLILKLNEIIGVKATPILESADIYIINTCAVTCEAEKKSRQAIARCLKYNKNAKIFILGCASQKNSAQFDNENIIYVGGSARKNNVINYIESILNENINHDTFVEYELPKSYEDNFMSSPVRTRTLIKIQDGCDNFCNYCIIPYLRGRSRSRPILSLIEDIKNISSQTNEIVLTGINVSDYGKDINSSLAILMEEISKLNLKVHIRLGSLEVNIINEKLLTSLKRIESFCPHFHLSLQSGDDNVLKSMNRHYTATAYIDAVNLIRKYFSKPCITTDIIVGFPTEDDIAFNNTVKLCKDINFSDIHIFQYSPREGTKAYSLKPLNSQIVKNRMIILTNLKQELKDKYLYSFIGNELVFLTECIKDGYTEGYSKEYIRVYVKGNLNEGFIYKVIPVSIFKDGILGKIV